ncbi:MAG: hypothetical protein WCC08_19255 [Terrimicrobiaceae bacterium]
MATTDGRPGSNESSIRIALQHVRVATVDGGEAGVLVIKEDQLVAVLTRGRLRKRSGLTDVRC